MTGAHAPDDVKVHIYVEPLSTPADQAFKEAREDDDADDATWDAITSVVVAEGEPVTDLGLAMKLAKDKAGRELLFGSSTAVAVPANLADFGEAWVFIWLGWK